GVEVLGCYTIFQQVPSSWGVRLERACWRDVVGSNGVAELQQNTCTRNVFNWFRLKGHALEVRRFPNIGGFWIPLKGFAFWSVQFLPAVISVENGGVFFGEHVRVNRPVNDGLNFGWVWPDLRQVDVVAFAVLPQWLVFEVEIHGACQSVGYNQWWRGQVVHLDVGVNAAFEVPVTGQH